MSLGPEILPPLSGRRHCHYPRQILLQSTLRIQPEVVYAEHAGGLAWGGENVYHGSARADGGADRRIQKYAVDGAHLTVFDPLPGDPEIEGLAYDGTHLWAAVRSDDSLYVLDHEDGTILRPLYVSSRSGDITVIRDSVWARSGGPLARIVP